jgi:hypothetical protein
MAQTGNNQVGEVNIKLGVDTSSVAAEAKAGAEKAAQAVKSDPALVSIQQTLSAQLGNTQRSQEAEKDALAMANAMRLVEERSARVMAETSKVTEEFLRLGQAGGRVFGESSPTVGGVKGLNKALSDSIGQVQGLIGKFTIVAGVATGMYALGRAIRESIISALESGTEKAEKFAGSLDLSKKAESIKSIGDQINKLAADLEDQSNNPLDRAVGFITGTNPDKLKEEIERLNKLAKSLRDNEQAARRRDEKLAAEKEAKDKEDIARKEAEKDAEASARGRERLAKEREDRAKASQDILDDLERIASRQSETARKMQEDYTRALRAIREESNRTFGSDSALSRTGLSASMYETAWKTNANLDRIEIGGTG